MSETLDTNGGSPQGKGQALTGFILALVSLVLAPVIAGIAGTMIIAGGSGWVMILTTARASHTYINQPLPPAMIIVPAIPAITGANTNDTNARINPVSAWPFP